MGAVPQLFPSQKELFLSQRELFVSFREEFEPKRELFLYQREEFGARKELFLSQRELFLIPNGGSELSASAPLRENIFLLESFSFMSKPLELRIKK